MSVPHKYFTYFYTGHFVIIYARLMLAFQTFGALDICGLFHLHLNFMLNMTCREIGPLFPQLCSDRHSVTPAQRVGSVGG